MPSKSKAVATRPKGGAVATRQTAELPDFMKGYAGGAGTELMRQEDVEIPRLALLQALSDPVAEGDEKPGNFWHTVAEVNLGSELQIVPVFTSHSYILWKPRDQGGGILARADDGVHWNPPKGEFEIALPGKRKTTWKLAKTVAESRLDQWGSFDPDDSNSPPAATKCYNVAAYLLDFPEYSPAVICLQRSAVKVAKKFVGKLMLTQAPSFGLVYTMSSIKDMNTAGQEFYNFKFTASGLLTDESVFKQTEAMYKHFKDMGLRVRDMEGAAEEHAGAEPKEY